MSDRSKRIVQGLASRAESNRPVGSLNLHDWCFRLARQAPSRAEERMRLSAPFTILETTIEEIHSAYRSGQLTARRLVRMYLDRIEAYDKKGPAINAII